MNPSLLKNPLITQRISKFVALKKKALKESENFFTKIDTINTKLTKLHSKVRTLPRNTQLKTTIILLRIMFLQFRTEVADLFTDIEIQLEFWTNLMRNYRRKASPITPYKTPNSFPAVLKLLKIASHLVIVRSAKPTPFLMASLLARVHYDQETCCGDFSEEIQDVFERVFLYRNDHVIKSLNNLAQAFKAHISFTIVEGFIRALTSKLIQDHRVTRNIPQLLLCVQRAVYPRVYHFFPEFFPFFKVSYRKPTEKPQRPIGDIDVPTFKKGQDLLNQLMFMTTPIDMINILLRAGSLFVDSFMLKHNMGAGVDFGAQELLPILEYAVTTSELVTPLCIFQWLDAYCQDMECEASASYIVASFLTVAQYAYNEDPHIHEIKQTPPVDPTVIMKQHEEHIQNRKPTHDKFMPLVPFAGAVPQQEFQDDESSDDVA